MIENYDSVKDMTYIECFGILQYQIKKIFSYVYTNKKIGYVLEDEKFIYKSPKGPSLIYIDILLDKLHLDNNKQIILKSYTPFILFHKFVMQYKAKFDCFASVYFVNDNENTYLLLHYNDLDNINSDELLVTFKFHKMTYELEKVDNHFTIQTVE